MGGRIRNGYLLYFVLLYLNAEMGSVALSPFWIIFVLLLTTLAQNEPCTLNKEGIGLLSFVSCSMQAQCIYAIHKRKPCIAFVYSASRKWYLQIIFPSRLFLPFDSDLI